MRSTARFDVFAEAGTTTSIRSTEEYGRHPPLSRTSRPCRRLTSSSARQLAKELRLGGHPRRHPVLARGRLQLELSFPTPPPPFSPRYTPQEAGVRSAESGIEIGGTPPHRPRDPASPSRFKLRAERGSCLGVLSPPTLYIPTHSQSSVLRTPYRVSRLLTLSSIPPITRRRVLPRSRPLPHQPSLVAPPPPLLLPPDRLQSPPVAPPAASPPSSTLLSAAVALSGAVAPVTSASQLDGTTSVLLREALQSPRRPRLPLQPGGHRSDTLTLALGSPSSTL